MKILDNKKDYYDYLSGIEGIDEHITYDRRNSFRINNPGTKVPALQYDHNLRWFFNPYANYGDPLGPIIDAPFKKDKESDKYLVGKGADAKGKSKKEYSCHQEFLGILVGTKIYIIRVSRIREKETDDKVKIKPSLVYTGLYNREGMSSRAPIIIGDVGYARGYWSWNDGRDYSDMRISRYRKSITDNSLVYLENPIMADTWIPSIIPPLDIWVEVSNYLLSLKDPKIEDNRSDVEKLESHGFDRKTSFRKDKEGK